MNAVLPVSSIYVALSALLVMLLLLRVAYLRNSLKIGIGDGGQSRLARAIRVHANAIECLPLALLMLVMLELCHAHPMGLHGLGAALLIARLMHAQGLSAHGGYSFGRFTGTVITVLVVIAMGGWLLWLNFAR